MIEEIGEGCLLACTAKPSFAMKMALKLLMVVEDIWSVYHYHGVHVADALTKPQFLGTSSFSSAR